MSLKIWIETEYCTELQLFLHQEVKRCLDYPIINDRGHQGSTALLTRQPGSNLV